MLIDSHAHLFFKDFKDDLDDLLGRARDAGVEYIVCPGTDLITSRAAVELADKYPFIYAAVGFHPHDASRLDEKSLTEIENLSRNPKVVAIGEIGLDYHYDFSPRDVQKEAFKKQLELAQKVDLPVIIHSREAEGEVMAILAAKTAEYPGWRKSKKGEGDRYPAPKGVFHCFPGDSKMAWEVVKMGFYVSLTGPVTYPEKPGRPNRMAEVASNLSADHILLETDSPYLAPTPYRGKRNEPAHLKLIAEKIAEMQHLSVMDIGRASSFGAHKLFGIGKYPDPVFTYTIRDSLYLNITLRCNADCVFCDRKGEAVVKGNNLRITREPAADELVSAISDPRKYQEVVFCGFGEPTIRFDLLKEVSRWIKTNGGKVRLNTDGHGSIINHRDIVPEMIGLVDSVSISLNSTEPDQYGELMRIDGRKYFGAMVDFAKRCVLNGLDVTMTMVDLDGVDEAKARLFVEKEIGAKFKNRPLF